MGNFKRGDIVKHKLTNVKMIVADAGITDEKIYCRWYKYKEEIWTGDYFYPEELNTWVRK